MSTNLEVLKQTELCGRQFKVYGTIENPLFLAKDVARMIHHSDVSMMLKRLDDEEKLIQTLLVSGQNRDVWFLTEDGLYEVLMQSRKPIAKQFKKGVKAVLKEIRTKGGYITTNPDDDEQTILAKAIIIANSTIEKIKADNQRLSQKIEEDAPKVLFANAVTTSDKSILVGELAKILKQNGVDMGQNRLFQWLRENGYLCSRGECYNHPTQLSMNLGLFEIKKVSIQKPDGKTMVNTVTKVSPKGQIYFIDKFLRNINLFS